MISQNINVRRSIHLSGPRPRKELGQHFLQDEEIAAQIVDAMELCWDERVLEIGPGRGVLLRFLLKRSHKVTAVEIDKRLKKSLEKVFGGHPGLRMVFGDFMKFNLEDYLYSESSQVKLVGNIPYNLSAPILFHLFDAAEQTHGRNSVPGIIESATLMLQKEVAERLCATPGGRVYGGLTVLRSLVANARLLFNVPASSFLPPPRVTSSVVQLGFYPQRRYQLKSPHLFKQFVHHVFAQRRKMLKNTMGSFPWIRRNWPGIEFDLTRRPEELSVEEFVTLFNLIFRSELSTDNRSTHH